MSSRVLLLAVLCAPAWGTPIISGSVSVLDLRPAPYGASASCNAPCFVNTISGYGSAWAAGGVDPAGLTMGVNIGASGWTTSRRALLAVNLSVTDGFVVLLNGQGAGTVEADVFLSAYSALLYPLSQMSVTLGGTNPGLNIPYPCPMCPSGISRTLTAPVLLQDPVAIALGISLQYSSWSYGLDERTRLAITGLRFYDAEGNRVFPAQSDSGSIPEPGTWSLLLGGVVIMTLMRRCRPWH